MSLCTRKRPSTCETRLKLWQDGNTAQSKKRKIMLSLPCAFLFSWVTGSWLLEEMLFSWAQQCKVLLQFSFILFTSRQTSTASIYKTGATQNEIIKMDKLLCRPVEKKCAYLTLVGVNKWNRASSITWKHPLLRSQVTDSCYPSLSSTSLYSYGKFIGAVENNPHCQ